MILYNNIIVKTLYTLTECTSNSDPIYAHYEVDINNNNNGIFHPLQSNEDTLNYSHQCKKYMIIRNSVHHK